MYDATISRCPQPIDLFSGKPNSIEPLPDNDEFIRWYLEYPSQLDWWLISQFWDDTERLPVVAGDEEVITVWTPLINEPSEVTGKGDVETASFSSSEDVDYSILCVICFKKRRNCFFVPCGHSATCRDCAQKILSEENKVCPICRRVIRKSKRLVLRL